MCERLYTAAMLVTHLWPHTVLVMIKIKHSVQLSQRNRSWLCNIPEKFCL